MIDLSLYPKYRRDIQSKQTNVYPIIIINFPENIEDGFDNSILVSTVKETFKYSENLQPLNFKDLGLNISNIKESTDITDRRFKISNVSISLSNYEYNGKRLSDYISDFPNSITKVYYKSQSCDLITDCLPVFTGLLRKVSYDDSKIRITLEDYTQSRFQKEVPTANLGNSENVYSKKYINKYIPMTYGKVDKAPAIPYKIAGESQGDDIVYYITDNVLNYNNKSVEITSFGSDDVIPEVNAMNPNIDSPFYIYKDDYYNILPEFNPNVSPNSGYWNLTQFNISDDSNFLYIEKYFHLSSPVNPPAYNELQCAKVQFPNGVKLLRSLTDDDTIEDDTGTSVFSLNPSTLSLDASIDSPTTKNSFISGENYLDTFAQIPSNEPSQEDMLEDGQFLVHDFVPHSDYDTYRRQIWYPPNVTYSHYAHMIVAWCYANAHQINVKFIEPPCFDLVWTRANEYLQSTYSQSLSNANSENKYKAQHQITEELQNAWKVHNNLINFENLEPLGWNWESYLSGSLGFSFRNATFPTSMYKFKAANNSDFDWVLVGQRSALCVDGVPESYWNHSGILFLNVFDDGTGTPYLFEKNECAIFNPIELLHRQWYGYGCGLHYKSIWNGTPFRNINSQVTGGVNMLNYGSPWSWKSRGDDPVPAHSCIGYGGTDPKTGSANLHMIFEEGVSEGILRTSFGDDNYAGYLTHGCTATIKPNTMIPCNHFQQYTVDTYSGVYYSTEFPHYDYVIPSNPDFITLNSGSNVAPDQRLTLIYDFSDISASDYLEGSIQTYIYGKLEVNFNSEYSSIDTNSNFRIQATAAEIQEGQISFDDNITEWNTWLVNVYGYDNFIDNIELQWSSITEDYDQENTLNEFDWSGGTKYQIPDWSSSPSYFNALALTYRLIGSNDKYLSLNTNINTIGLMQFIVFENIFSSDFYVDVYGRANSIEDTYIDNGIEKLKYTDSESDTKQLIENPADIMYHFIEKELGYKDIVSIDSWKKARDINSSFNLAFSLKEKHKSKDLIEKIAKNTLLFPRFKQDGTFGFTNIKLEYGDEDAELVNSDDAIAVSLENTELKDIKTIVNVKYKTDYAEDELIKETGYIDAYDVFGNGDLGYEGGYKYNYYGLQRDDNIFEFESEFIRDRATAMALRDFIFMQNCNQHTIIKATLPIHYTHLETGDIVKFSKVINNLKSFGEDYSSSNPDEVYRNGQKIYPYFLITSVTKSPKNVKVECIQLHKLTREFTAGLGSLSRMSQTGALDANPNNAINPTDLTILENYLAGNSEYFTSGQKQSADIISNGAINIADFTRLQTISGLSDTFDDTEQTPNEELQLGDINADGQINVVDVVNLVNYILGGDITEEQIALSDYNQDGQVNVVDIVNIVSEILGE
nr:phage tail protein [uncultured Mediterranean phage uvMED]